MFYLRTHDGSLHKNVLSIDTFQNGRERLSMTKGLHVIIFIQDFFPDNILVQPYNYRSMVLSQYAHSNVVGISFRIYM